MTFSDRIKGKWGFHYLVVGGLLIGLLVTDEARSQQIHLNEVMASNSSIIADEDGDYGDWIEIYNSGETPISLDGYGLSDDYDSPFRWVFPDTTLDAGSFMLIWATNKDRSAPGSELHTNFAISSSGEEVILTHPDSTRIDELPPREIPTDWSVGRQPDGIGEWFYFDDPTPGSANLTKPVPGILEHPVFSHEAGFYSEPFELSIAHPREGVTIYYTLDGSEPTSSSAVYEGPIEIRDRTSEPNIISMIPTNRITTGSRRWMQPSGLVSKGTVVRVKAVHDALISVSTLTQTYFVFGTDSNRYTLPVISLNTDAANLFDEEIGIYVSGIYYDRNVDWSGNYYQRGMDWERPASIEYFETTGERVLSQQAGIRIHGGWTRRLPMKSLRLYARSEYDMENRFNHSFFPELDDSSFNRLILRNSGQDFGRTMFKDIIAQELVSHLNLETQAYQPAILFINGEYWGIHNIRERYDRFYFERVYGVEQGRIDYLTGSGSVIEGDDLHYREMISYIVENDLSDDEKFEELHMMMDIDNFMDYFSIQIYYGNTDWPHNNIDYWRSKNEFDPDAPAGLDGRWRWVVFDLDRSLGNPEDASFNMIEWVTEEINFNGREWPNLILRNLLENRTFRDQFINRMADHLNSTFSSGRVIRKIDQMALNYEPEMEEHIRRWGVPAGVNWWRGYVSEMRDFARDRPSMVRSHIRDHFGISSETVLNIDPGPESMGAVYVNSLQISTQTKGISESEIPWRGRYFSGIDVKLHAVPNPGHEFQYWLIDDEIFYDPEIILLPETADSIKVVFQNGEDVENPDPGSDPDPDPDPNPGVPDSHKLYQNYPNPFHPFTTIKFDLPKDQHVKLEIYSVSGQFIKTVIDQTVPAGRHSKIIDASALASGIYLYRLSTNEFAETLRMTVIK